MTIFVRCRCANTSLRYRNLRHGEYLLSNHDGWTDRRRRKNHYGTSHQVRKTLRRRRDLREGGETFAFLDVVIKLVICTVAVIPTSKKIFSAGKTVDDTLGIAPSRSSPCSDRDE